MQSNLNYLLKDYFNMDVNQLELFNQKYLLKDFAESLPADQLSASK
jgi:hypothetical protein